MEFTLFSIAALTLQCAACPAARPFLMLSCLRGAWDKGKSKPVQTNKLSFFGKRTTYKALP
jgi:hypothetical protein